MKEQTKSTGRQSNIELLRIVAMIMIVAYHIVYQCVNSQLSNPYVNEVADTTLFHEPHFFKQLLILESIIPFGKAGDAIFILISGYFLSEKMIDIVKPIRKLFLQMAFASIVLVVGSNVYYHLGTAGKLVFTMGVSQFNAGWWFVGYYIGIIILAFLWMNGFLQKADKKKHLTFIAICFAIASNAWLGGVFTSLTSLASDLRVIIIGMFLYGMGSYIRKYDPFGNIPGLLIVLAIAGLYILIWISFYNLTTWNIENYLLNNSEDMFSQMLSSYRDYDIIPVILALAMFELARRIHMPNIGIINRLSASTFMVYLMHQNETMLHVMRERDWVDILYHSGKDFCLMLAKWTFIIFGFGVVVYALYCLTAKICGVLAVKYRKKEERDQ